MNEKVFTDVDIHENISKLLHVAFFEKEERMLGSKIPF